MAPETTTGGAQAPSDTAVAATTTTNDDNSTTTTSPPSMIATVKSYLNDKGLAYSMLPIRDTNIQSISIVLVGNHSTYRSVLEVKRQEERFSVFIYCPVKVPERRLAPAAEYLMRVNTDDHCPKLGCVELDYDDGEVRFRTSMDVDESSLTATQLDYMIMASAQTLDALFPDLMQVVFAFRSAQDAFENGNHAAQQQQRQAALSASSAPTMMLSSSATTGGNQIHVSN